ncbi:MobC family plasmid mobilization relaxosome protein [Actinomadura harenae]|uniref:Plasmid mobilization relaxosome protein MobC n=1 Tax=Actinomadura harenae TaxID=2483351 RepID=A0A3M2ME22_9ACTN|nr:plasmid mobilization relaxosome protein MobC [Actinomadura harenae]
MSTTLVLHGTGRGPEASQEVAATEVSAGGGRSSRRVRRSPMPKGRERERVMRFRVNDEEYAFISEQAKQQGMAYGAFIAHTIRVAGRHGKAGDSAALADLIESMQALDRQMNRIGVNLNQLARIANTTGYVPDELAGTLIYLTRTIRQVDDLIVQAGRSLR